MSGLRRRHQAGQKVLWRVRRTGPMKKPWVAFLLNFLLPGAGLAYLGKWGWAVFNFVVVLILAFLLAAAVPPDSLGAVSAGLGAASGSLAMSMAGGMNAKANARPMVAAANPAWQ